MTKASKGPTTPKADAIAADAAVPAAPKKRRPSGVDRGERQAPAASSAADSLDEQIRMRAYFLSLERGGAPGDPHDDWIRAEAELNRQSPRPRLVLVSQSPAQDDVPKVRASARRQRSG